MPTTSADRFFDFSPTDRALAALHDEAPFALQLGVDFDAELDTSRLVEALRLVARRHPILGATVDRSDPRPVWRPGTTTPAFLGPDASTSLSSDTLDASFLDLAIGPTMLVAHRLAATQSRLVIGLHHAVADGRGLLLVLDDLRRIYVALDAGVDPDVDVDWNPRNVESLLAAHQVTMDERARMMWDLMGRWASVPRSTHADAPGDADPASRHTVIELDDALLGTVEALALTRGWRLNHVMLASLARAWARAFDDDGGSESISGWLVSVDSRRPFRSTRGVGNLSGLEPATLTAVASTDLPGLVDQARMAFAPLGRRGAGLAADLVSPPLGLVPQDVVDRATRDTIASRTARLRSSRLYSHTDRLPEGLGDWGATQATGVRWLPPPRVAAPYVAFVLVRFRGVTTLTPYASTACLAPRSASTLADELRESLAEFVDSV
jgi:hypothetical protein